MSYPLRFNNPDPEYDPEIIDFSRNFNVLHLAEIHAFEPEYRKDKYLDQIGEQIDSYAEKYDVDRVSILGDTGSIEDMEEILDPLKDDIEIWIIAGDEDKKEVYPEDDPGNTWRGWFSAATSPEPFDIDNPYRIFDEGYETEIRGHTLQAAHHPKKEKRKDSISPPDPRAVTEEPDDPETFEEFLAIQEEEDPLERLFSVDRDSNEQKEVPPLPSLEGVDMALYDHVHMPYARKLYDTAVIGLGGRSHNYQLAKDAADAMPLRSLHLNSFSDDQVHALHFDADDDSIFEHLVFDYDDELEVYNVPTPGASIQGYLPLQNRFTTTQYEERAREAPEDEPDLWRNRETG